MRPNLNKDIDPDIFKDYYWLKEELVEFCKELNIPKNGKKQVITARIYHYLKTGDILKEESQKSEVKPICNVMPTLDGKIPNGYRNDEVHRAFFKSVIGEHFKFNVPFMNWMKTNAGKTYEDAVNQWNLIYEEKKSGKKYEISSQFEYNQYTRDFFKHNPKSDRESAIRCWKYKKSLSGHNKYEDSDLSILNENNK